jgi:hypothetical protein
MPDGGSLPAVELLTGSPFLVLTSSTKGTSCFLGDLIKHEYTVQGEGNTITHSPGLDLLVT